MAVESVIIKYHRTDDDGNVVEIQEIQDDYISANARRTSKIKNNSSTITLQNPFVKMVGDIPVHKWTNDDGSLIFKAPRKVNSTSAKFQNEEKIEIFAQAQEEKVTLDTSDNSPYRLFTGFITEIEGKGELGKTQIKLKLRDRNSIMLNVNGVGIYDNPYKDGTLTGTTSTTATDSSESWTVDDLKGKILVMTSGATEYRYTIKSNTATVLTLQPDDDVSGDGFSTDAYTISWTSPAIMRDQLRKFQNRANTQTNQMTGKFDFDSSDRYLITAITSNTITLSGSSYSTDELVDRTIYISSGTAKGYKFNVRTNTGTVLTIYGETDLTTLGVTTSTDYLTISDADAGIETIRPDGTAYPVTVFAKAFKPLHEWFNELAEGDKNNTSDELNDDTVSLVIKRPLVYHVNTNNVFYVFYPRDNASVFINTASKVAISPDNKKHRILPGRSVKNKVLDNVNFIIYRYKDFSGTELLDYEFDPLSGAPVVQDCYKPYFTISNTIISQAYRAGEIQTEEYDATLNASAYDGSSYPTFWDVSYDDTKAKPDTAQKYKDLFEIAAQKRCESRARAEINGSGTGKWSATIPLDFEILDVNSLVNYIDYPFGVNQSKMRIKEINYDLKKGAFRATLKMEEDPDDLEKEV